MCLGLSLAAAAIAGGKQLLVDNKQTIFSKTLAVTWGSR
jgi:hypothetical protein